MPGPVPKRIAEFGEHSHRKIPTVDTLPIVGDYRPPPLNIDDPHDIVRQLYEAAKRSAQARYFEPTDWQMLRLTLTFADKLLKSSRPSGQMLAVVHSMLGDLLTSEGARRRLRIEVERRSTDEKDNVLDVASLFRERLAAAN